MKIDPAALDHAVVVAVYHKIIGGDDRPIIVIPPGEPPTPFPGPEPGPLYANLGILQLAAEARDPELAKIAAITARAIRNQVLHGIARSARAA